MSTYAIVAETGADIPADLVERYHLHIVPMHVTVGNDTYDDGALAPADMYERCRELGVMPHTSASTPGDFATVFDVIHAEQPEATIIYLAYSAVTTCSYESALTAAAGRDYVVAIDTQNVTAGQGIIVVHTARFIEEHPEATVDEIRAFVDGFKRRVVMAFVPGDLGYLRAGGRLSNAQFLGAHLLKIKPVIEIEDGRLVATKKLRGAMVRAAVHLIDCLAIEYELDRSECVLLYSPGLSDLVRRTVEARVRALGIEEFRWQQTGTVISSHCGPSTFGIVLLRAE